MLNTVTACVHIGIEMSGESDQITLQSMADGKEY